MTAASDIGRQDAATKVVAQAIAECFGYDDWSVLTEQAQATFIAAAEAAMEIVDGDAPAIRERTGGTGK